MKILLLIPPLNFRKSVNELYSEYSCDGSLPPLGAMYLASVLKQEEFNVKLIDLSVGAITPNSFVTIIKKENPDIVGFSIIADSVNTSLILAEKIKEIKPECIIIAGGISPTFLYSNIMNSSPNFDIIVRGEGELILLEIVKLIEKGLLSKKISQIKSIVYKTKSNEIKINGEIAIIDQLDSLPFPDRKISNFNYTYQFGEVQLSSRKFTSILTSRGCPFRCKFCACSVFSKNRYRERSAENVLEEFELIYSQGYRQALITDDHFFVNPKRTMKILQGLKKNNIEMDLLCESRVDYANKELLKQAEKSGVKAIFYGMESGSQKILDYYNKKINISQIKMAVDKTRAAKINMIVGSFMYGAPNETISDMMLTSKLILDLDIDVAVLNIVDILPGTPMWFEAENKDILPNNAWSKTLHAVDIYKNSVTLPKIKQIIDRTYELFMKRGNWISKQIKRSLFNKWRRGLIYYNLRKTGLTNLKRVFNEITSSKRMYRYQEPIEFH